MDRDVNSARNILLRFLAWLAPHRLSEVCGVLGVIQAINMFYRPLEKMPQPLPNPSREFGEGA
jgi:transposase